LREFHGKGGRFLDRDRLGEGEDGFVRLAGLSADGPAVAAFFFRFRESVDGEGDVELLLGKIGRCLARSRRG
jgi:hypothetical protein